MSFDLNISVKDTKFNATVWEEAIRDELPNFKFTTEINWENYEGFIPVSWDDNENIETGFEFHLENLSTKGKMFGLLSSPKHKWNVTISVKGDDAEQKIAWVAAGTLAKLFSGILTNPQSGNSYEGDAALAQAQEEIKPKIFVPNKYNTFDFKAHNDGHKANLKELNKLVRKRFKPLGIMKKGSSSWLYDQGWYTIYLEFKTSKSEHRMLVNVAATIHWNVKDYWAFDVSMDCNTPKFDSFEELGNNNEALIELVLAKAEELKEIMSDLERLEKFVEDSIHIYEPYKSKLLAKLCVLQGNNEEKKAYFEKVMNYTHGGEEYDWIIELKAKNKELNELSSNLDSFKELLIKNIKVSRQLKKLSEMEIELPS